MTYISEKYQLGILNTFLEDNGIEYVTEGKVYSIPIDILGLHDGDLISIELKARNLMRGIAQANRNTLFSDFSYVSLWEEEISENFLERTSDSPIGIIAVGDEATVVREPSRVSPNKYAKETATEVIDQ